MVSSKSKLLNYVNKLPLEKFDSKCRLCRLAWPQAASPLSPSERLPKGSLPTGKFHCIFQRHRR